jgi:MFS family permease
MFYLFAVVFGITHGGSSPILASMSADIFGRRNLGVIMGILTAIHSIGAAIGPFIGGLVYDVNGSYAVAFLITAAVSALMAVSIALVRMEAKSEIK